MSAINKRCPLFDQFQLQEKQLSLVSKMKIKFTYKSDKGDFDEYFNDEPLWSEGYK